MNDEIQALRRMAQVLARVATPLERQNIARRVAQKTKGDDSELALTLAHAAALFWPGDAEKTAEVLQQITLAFDAGELGGFIPREHRHILFTDLTVWPDCPPMAADSPLRFWVPDAPAQPQAATPVPVVVDSASNPPLVAGSASNEPLPLTTSDIAFCFDGIRWNEKGWRKPLGDKPKWLQSCVAIPGQRGVSETRWNPVLIAAALVDDGHTQARSIRARFQTKPQLRDWLEAWKTYESDYFDAQ